MLLVGVLVVMGALILAAPAGSAERLPGGSGSDDNGLTLVLFHGEGCPHCAAELAFLDELTATHPELQVEAHEVWYDEQGQQLLDRHGPGNSGSSPRGYR